MNHIIAISTRISIEYINIGNIKKLMTIEAVAGKDTAFASPIIWDERLRIERISLGPYCDKLFIGGVEDLLHYAKCLLALSLMLTGP